MPQNSSDKNGVLRTLDYLLNQSETKNNFSEATNNPWEIGLQGGKQLAEYYENLVKIGLKQQNLELDSQMFRSRKLEEQNEIRKWEAKFR